jgi:hypothetical protein
MRAMPERRSDGSPSSCVSAAALNSGSGSPHARRAEEQKSRRAEEQKSASHIYPSFGRSCSGYWHCARRKMIAAQTVAEIASAISRLFASW